MGRPTMSAPSPATASAGRLAKRAISAGAFCALVAFAPAHGQGSPPQQSASIPDFSPSSRVGWLKADVGDEFLAPGTGPGPVVSDPAHGWNAGKFLLSNGSAKPFKIADLTNPILQPWVVESMRTANDEVLAGKVGFTARSRCWPHGVPGFLLYPVHPIFFIQAPNEVVMVWGQDFQARHVYLNVPHSSNPKPSWYGESVGHYENGDTLVVDTIGFNDRTYVDNFRTPHTTRLHVTERFQLIDGGEALEVQVHVEDEGAFTMPWNARQRYRRDQRKEEVPLHEMVCAENNEDHFNQGLVPIPQADRVDF